MEEPPKFVCLLCFDCPTFPKYVWAKEVYRFLRSIGTVGGRERTMQNYVKFCQIV